MKQLILLTALCTALSCHAADADPTAAMQADSAASAVGSPPKGRCPPPRFDKMRKLPNGNFEFTLRFLVKTDGSIEDIRVEGGDVPLSLDARRAARGVLEGLRCLPADADQEYTLRLGSSTGYH